MISPRIKAIGDMIPDNTHIIDVGCDHALLDVYVVKKNQNVTALATDISAIALEQAKKNIKENALEDKIKTQVADGLKHVKFKKNDYIVVSGMGANTIVDILGKYAKKIDHVIIQANRGVDGIRMVMNNYGFKIVDEKVVYDKRYYIIIKYEKGKEKLNLIDFWLGPIIKNSSYETYFKYLVKYYENLADTIPDYEYQKKLYLKRASELKTIIEKKWDR